MSARAASFEVLTHSKVARSHEGQVGAGFWPVLLYVICRGILEGPDSMAPGFPQRGQIQGPQLQYLLGPTLRSYTVTSAVFYCSPILMVTLNSAQEGMEIKRLGSRGHGEGWLPQTFSALRVTYAETSQEEQAG